MQLYADRPRVVIWEMTRACALACQHCRARAIPHRNAGELTTEEAFAFIDALARGGPCVFVLTGGDPFMRPDLFEIVAYAAARDLHVAVSPSGTGRLRPEALAKLYDAGCKRISLSIDGPTAQTHDAFRGVKGTFDRTVAAAHNARKAGIAVQVNTTIARHNHNQLRDMPAVLEEIDADVWTAFFLVPTGRAKIEDGLDDEATERAFGVLFDIWKSKPPFAIRTTEAPHFRRYVAQHIAYIPAGERPVDAAYYRAPAIGDGKGFAFVSHVGDICPSGFLELTCGNVREDDLLEVYRTDPTFQRLRDPDLFNGKCGVCTYRYLCGGSRARAYGYTRDPFGPDPSCTYALA